MSCRLKSEPASGQLVGPGSLPPIILERVLVHFSVDMESLSGVVSSW